MNEPRYIELTRMTDDELLQHGWKRNDRGGLTRLTKSELLGSKKGFGFMSFVRAMTGGSANATLQYERIKVCNACQATDSKGERLYRIVEETAYCGVPRDLGHLDQVYRDEVKEGCGCSLLLKVSKYEADCPLNKWPDKTKVKPIPPQIQKYPAAQLQVHPTTIVRKPCGCGKAKKP